MGVFPRRHATLTVDYFSPMAKYLSRQLQRRVFVESAQDFETFWENLRNRRYDIVHYNQYHYIRTHKDLNYEIMLMNEERGRSTITASIVVRRNAGYRTVQDLKGKTIFFGGGQKAMQSYIYATYLLHQGGLKDGDYGVRFGQNPPSAIVAAYHGLWDAAAAGTGDVVLELPVVTKQINADEMTYLVKGEQFAQLPWAIKGELPDDVKQAVKNAMLQLNNSPQGGKILKKAKLTGLLPAVDSDYDPHRRIVKEVLGEIY